MNKKILVFVFGMLFVGICSAVAQEQHPIDKFEADCIDRDMTTASMANCTYEAMVLWDKDMNKYYGLLMKILNKDEQVKLREAQRAWLKFRDAEFHSIDAIYSRVDGTMYLNTRVADYLTIVKDRARALSGYYRVKVGS
jgi:uncharacterized protein YecT (DUF1311 family)